MNTNEKCTKCHKRPIAIKKFGVCRACYAKMRRAGDIRPYDPIISETDIANAIFHGIERAHEKEKGYEEKLSEERKINKNLADQNNALIQQNDKLKLRVIELQKEIEQKKTRGLRLSDLQKLVRSEK